MTRTRRLLRLSLLLFLASLPMAIALTSDGYVHLECSHDENYYPQESDDPDVRWAPSPEHAIDRRGSCTLVRGSFFSVSVDHFAAATLQGAFGRFEVLTTAFPGNHIYLLLPVPLLLTDGYAWSNDDRVKIALDTTEFVRRRTSTLHIRADNRQQLLEGSIVITAVGLALVTMRTRLRITARWNS